MSASGDARKDYKGSAALYFARNAEAIELKNWVIP